MDIAIGVGVVSGIARLEGVINALRCVMYGAEHVTTIKFQMITAPNVYCMGCD